MSTIFLKLIPGLLAPLSIGLPLLSVVGDSFDQGVRLGNGNTQMWTNDKDYLRERNSDAFGVEGNHVGKAWSAGKVGDIYEDKTYYSFSDFGWLDGVKKNGHKVTGAEQIKTQIKGIGLKLTKVSGGPIWGGKGGLTYGQMRLSDYKNDFNSKKVESGKRVMDVQRVVYFSGENGEKGTLGKNGRGVCLAKVEDKSLGNLYFVVGVAVTEGNKSVWTVGDQMKWGRDSKFIDSNEDVCHRFGGGGGKSKKLTLAIPFTYNSTFEAKLSNQSVITIASEDGKTIYWESGPKKEKRVGVLLGVFRKKKLRREHWTGSFEEKAEIIDENKYEFLYNWHCGKEDDECTAVGIQFSGKTSWEPVDKWNTTIDARFQWDL